MAIAAGAGGCEQPTALGQSTTRASDVHREPTPHHVVTEMLELANVGANDIVHDLACGDGRVVIAAVRLGARGVCVDIDLQRIRESFANAENADVTQRIVPDAVALTPRPPCACAAGERWSCRKAAATFATALSVAAAPALLIDIYKSPACGCCGARVKHLKAASKITVEARPNRESRHAGNDDGIPGQR